jgi:hypothetical protein
LCCVCCVSCVRWVDETEKRLNPYTVNCEQLNKHNEHYEHNKQAIRVRGWLRAICSDKCFLQKNRASHRRWDALFCCIAFFVNYPGTPPWVWWYHRWHWGSPLRCRPFHSFRSGGWPLPCSWQIEACTHRSHATKRNQGPSS